MVHPDLNFYQSTLKSFGIKYVLGASVRPEPALVHTPAPTKVHPVKKNRQTENSNDKKNSLSSISEIDNVQPHLIKFLRTAYSVWTYLNLPEDIKKGFTTPRGELLSNIVKNLGWNKQACTLWPVSVINDSEPVPDRDFFYRGLRQIKPAYIFIFGCQAFKIITEDRLDYRYGQQYLGNHQLIILPDINTLLPDNRILKNLVWNILKQYTPPQY